MLSVVQSTTKEGCFREKRERERERERERKYGFMMGHQDLCFYTHKKEYEIFKVDSRKGPCYDGGKQSFEKKKRRKMGKEQNCQFLYTRGGSISQTRLRYGVLSLSLLSLFSLFSLFSLSSLSLLSLFSLSSLSFSLSLSLTIYPSISLRLHLRPHLSTYAIHHASRCFVKGRRRERKEQRNRGTEEIRLLT